MIQFEYPSSGIGRKERKKYTFSNFRGVDTSVAPINVDSVRAVESTNFVDRNGVLHGSQDARFGVRSFRSRKHLPRSDGRIARHRYHPVI